MARGREILLQGVERFVIGAGFLAPGPGFPAPGPVRLRKQENPPWGLALGFLLVFGPTGNVGF